jgi:hypothetical protein
MEMKIRDKESYYRNLEWSFVATLIFLILILYIYPRFEQTTGQNIQYSVPSLEVLYIPKTVQKYDKRPKPVKPFIPVEAEEIEILDNVEIDEILEGDPSANNLISGPVNYTDLPYTPRQLFETMPEKMGEPVSGIIILSLRIGVDGGVKEYKLLKNTTNSLTCLRNVVKAAIQSKWESAVLRGRKVEYWIDKTYRFK